MKSFIAALAAWIITLGVPVLLILGTVRLVMTPQVLAFEYQRPDMTPDYYGFTLADRLRYGPLGIEYLVTDADISLLGDLRFPEGNPLFTERELDHMVDVKIVTDAALDTLLIFALLVPTSAVALVRSGRRVQLRNALLRGAIITLGGVVTVVFGAIVAWDTFFTLFHKTFFADGTWIFYTSDTLIRLYPEKFWFDAALIIGVVTIGGSLLIVVFTFRLWRTDISGVDPAESRAGHGRATAA